MEREAKRKNCAMHTSWGSVTVNPTISDSSQYSEAVGAPVDALVAHTSWYQINKL